MFDKFSDEAIEVIMHAQEEARILKHHWVGSDHILLSLIAIDSDCLCFKVLSSFDVNLINARVEVEKLNPKGRKSPKELPFSPSAIRTLECAFRAAMAENSTIRPEHLLLGLLEDPDSVAVRVLTQLGVVRQFLRMTILYRTQFGSRHLGDDGSVISQEDARYRSASSKVFMLAQAEARRLGHNFVGTEQILLGMIAAGGKLAAVFEEFGITLETTRLDVEEIIGAGSGFVAVEIPFTPRAKRVLELAWEEARQLGHSFVSGEHLLLGLIRESDGVAYRVLKERDVDLDRLKQAVIALFDQS